MFRNRLFSVFAFTLFILIFSGTVFAAAGQIWMNTYNGLQPDGKGYDLATRMVRDQDGNILIAGSSVGPAGITGMAVVKYRPDGTQFWTRRYDSPFGPSAQNRVNFGGMAVDPSGNVYIAGTVWTETVHNFIFIKYQPDGILSWIDEFPSDRFPHDWVHNVIADGAGNIYVSGHLYIDSPQEYVVVKFSPAGDTLWTRKGSGGGGYFGYAPSMTIDQSGAAYVSLSGNIVKYDSDGNLAWNRHYDDVNFGPSSLDHAGNLYVGGWRLIPGDGFSMIVVKCTPDGSEMWQRIYQTPLPESQMQYDNLINLAIDPSDNLVVVGRSTTDTTFEDFLTIKYSPSGDIIWERRYEAQGMPLGIAIDPDGNIFVAGETTTDWLALGYDPDGRMIWRHKLANCIGTELQTDTEGNLFLIGGISLGSALYEDDFLAIRYTPRPFPHGDANADELLNIGDAVFLINHVFKAGPAPDIANLADANCDGRINIGDVVFLINHIFKGAAAPGDCVTAR
jgi:hypothetical protein